MKQTNSNCSRVLGLALTFLLNALSVMACVGGENFALTSDKVPTTTSVPGNSTKSLATPVDTPTMFVATPAKCEAGGIIFKKALTIDAPDQTEGIFMACLETSDPHLIYPTGASVDNPRVIVGNQLLVSLFVPDPVPSMTVIQIDLTDYSSQSLFEWQGTGYGYEVSWSPDGEYIAYLLDTDLTTGDAAVEMLHLETGTVSRIATGYSLDDLSWSPDGRRLFFSVGAADQVSDTLLHILEVNCVPISYQCEGANETIIPYQIGRPIWSQDSRSIIGLSSNTDYMGMVYQYLSASGNIIREINIGSIDPNLIYLGDVAESPDGSQLAFVAQDTSNVDNIYVLDLKSLSLSPVTHHTSADLQIYALAWMPCQSLIACARRDSFPH